MAVSSVLAFWTVALLLIVVPGADWAFTINAGLRGDSMFPAVGGLVAGHATVTFVVAAGVGALVAGSPALLTGLTLAGGLYLMWHGATTLAHPPTHHSPAGDAAADSPGRAAAAPAGRSTDGSTGRSVHRPFGRSAGRSAGSGWKVFRRGIGVSGLNPKGLLIFLALLPQFTDPHGTWPVAGQIGVLGLAFMASCALFYQPPHASSAACPEPP